MKKIIFIITIIVIILNVSVFTQEVRDPNKNDVYVKVYERQNFNFNTHCYITSTLYSSAFCTTYNTAIGYSYYWKGFKNGRPISSYEFFKLTGYHEEAEKEKEFRNYQIKYNTKKKKELDDNAAAGWAIWFLIEIPSIIITFVGLGSENYTAAGVAGGLSLFNLALIALPIKASLDAENYDPNRYVYSAHDVELAEYASYDHNTK